jgi:hypothetical protein
MAHTLNLAEMTARCVLSRVPRVTFETEPGRDAEGVPFPACLRAALEYLGDDHGYKYFNWRHTHWRQSNLYTLLMGVSGAAFRLSWGEGWQPDNSDIRYLAPEPLTPIDRAFRAVGYTYEHLSQEEAHSEAEFRQRLLQNVCGRSRPVLGFGVAGPPECCLITGYDDHGDTLIGWSFFQNIPPFNADLQYEKTGEFRKRDWFKDTPALLVIGERQSRPDFDDVACEALRFALEVTRTPLIWPERYNGLAAYTAWARALEDDQDFPAGDLPTLRQRQGIHDDMVNVIAEGRWYASHFLWQVAEHEPEIADDLAKAALCYENEHDQMWDLWRLVGGVGRSDAHALKLADPAIRREMVPIIKRARDKDAEAALHIERALQHWWATGY